jgi:hypothetical protein
VKTFQDLLRRRLLPAVVGCRSVRLCRRGPQPPRTERRHHAYPAAAVRTEASY